MDSSRARISSSASRTSASRRRPHRGWTSRRGGPLGMPSTGRLSPRRRRLRARARRRLGRPAGVEAAAAAVSQFRRRRGRQPRPPSRASEQARDVWPPRSTRGARARAGRPSPSWRSSSRRGRPPPCSPVREPSETPGAEHRAPSDATARPWTPHRLDRPCGAPAPLRRPRRRRLRKSRRRRLTRNLRVSRASPTRRRSPGDDASSPPPNRNKRNRPLRVCGRARRRASPRPARSTSLPADRLARIFPDAAPTATGLSPNERETLASPRRRAAEYGRGRKRSRVARGHRAIVRAQRGSEDAGRVRRVPAEGGGARAPGARRRRVATRFPWTRGNGAEDVWDARVAISRAPCSARTPRQSPNAGRVGEAGRSSAPSRIEAVGRKRRRRESRHARVHRARRGGSRRPRRARKRGAAGDEKEGKRKGRERKKRKMTNGDARRRTR